MEIPPQLRQNYIDRRKNDLPVLKDALEKADFATLQRIGHQLKGNGSTFGFDQLAQIGEKLESASKIQDASRVNQLTEQLIAAISGLTL